MRRLGLRALLASVMSLGFASASWAGFSLTGDRSDVLDVSNTMQAQSLDGLKNNEAFLFMEANPVGTNFADGTVSVGTGATKTAVRWLAFEPDQTKRTSTSGQVQQKDQVAFLIIQAGVQVFPDPGTHLNQMSPVPGCKAKVQLKGPKGATSATVDNGNWSVNCNKKAASALTGVDFAALQTALGKKIVGKDSLNIKGECKDTAHCDF